jgi:hypothetical protein
MPPKAKGQGRDGAGAASAARGARIAQAFIEAMAEDPEAVSAFGVARGRLAAGRGLLGLRRMRVFELSGALPGRAALAGLLHRSIQFYNPAKERCTLRLQAGEAAPIGADEIGVLVVERGGERRPAAERWWRHETGTTVEIREVWRGRSSSRPACARRRRTISRSCAGASTACSATRTGRMLGSRPVGAAAVVCGAHRRARGGGAGCGCDARIPAAFRAAAEGRCEARREDEGPAEEIGTMTGWSADKTWREECGIFAAYGVPRAAEIVGLGLHALQHRGQESTGIVSCDPLGEFHSQKGLGLVSDVYDETSLARLSGTFAIGHNRYSTTGSLTLENTQPLRVVYRGGALALAHNGNLVNARELRTSLEGSGSIFQTTLDTEILLHLMALSSASDPEAALVDAARQVRGAFSLLLLAPDRVIALRDATASARCASASSARAGWWRVRRAPWTWWAPSTCARSSPASW